MKQTITVDAAMDNLDTLISRVRECLLKAGCPQVAMSKILLCVEEVFVNITNYAYRQNKGTCTVEVEAAGNGADGEACFIIRDSGVPFNPVMLKEPDITLSADEREIGGLGIFMVKKIMDDISYEYAHGENIFIMRKKWRYDD